MQGQGREWGENVWERHVGEELGDRGWRLSNGGWDDSRQLEIGKDMVCVFDIFLYRLDSTVAGTSG